MASLSHHPGFRICLAGVLQRSGLIPEFYFCGFHYFHRSSWGINVNSKCQLPGKVWIWSVMALIENEFRAVLLLMLDFCLGCGDSGFVEACELPLCQYLFVPFKQHPFQSPQCWTSGTTPMQQKLPPALELPKHSLGLLHPLMLLHGRSCLDLVCSSPAL